MAGSERGLTIASDSLGDNADTIQGHHPQGSNFKLEPPPHPVQLPFQCYTATPLLYCLVWTDASPCKGLRAPIKSPEGTKSR